MMRRRGRGLVGAEPAYMAELAQLRAQGIINDAEFEAKKAQIQGL